MAHPLLLGPPVEQAGAEEKVGEVVHRHPGVLGERGRRKLAADPLEVEGEDALDVRSDAGLEPSEALLVEAGHLAGVLGGLHADPGIRLVKWMHLDRRRIVE